MDSSLNWSAHINNVVNRNRKLFRSFGKRKKKKRLRDLNVFLLCTCSKPDRILRRDMAWQRHLKHARTRTRSKSRVKVLMDDFSLSDTH